MKTIFSSIAMASFLLALSGCAAVSLESEAERIEFVKEVPKNCQFVGDVVGGQGNWFTTGWTVDKDLVAGSRNDIRNKAAEMNANVVVMDTSVQSARGLFAGGVHSSVVAGTAWLCLGRPARSMQ